MRLRVLLLWLTKDGIKHRVLHIVRFVRLLLSARTRAWLFLIKRVLSARMVSRNWVAADVCCLLLIVMIVDHVSHLSMSKLLSLIETCLCVVIFAAIIVELILDCPHDEFISSWLVWDFF